MDEESRTIIKIVGIYDLIITIVVSMILYVMSVSGFYYFPLGILISFINFIVNADTIKRIVMKEGNLKVLVILLSYAIRIGLVCIPGIAIFKANEINFFIFIAGYTSQLLAIVLYGGKLVKVKGAD